MSTIFVDSNIILDVLLQNEGFWQDSLKIFHLAEKKEICAYISSSCVTDIFYIVRKRFGIPAARDAIIRILNIFEIAGVDGYDLKTALTVEIDDLEDALQAWCAERIGAEILISRDLAGFQGIKTKVLTPAEFSE
jgi:predicted nucleic acid-binding protein